VGSFNVHCDLFFDDFSNNSDQVWIKCREFIIHKTKEFCS